MTLVEGLLWLPVPSQDDKTDKDLQREQTVDTFKINTVTLKTWFGNTSSFWAVTENPLPLTDYFRT